MDPLAFLMSSSSAVAVSFQESMRSLRSLADSRIRLLRLNPSALSSRTLTTPSRPLTPGRILPLLSLRTSRTPADPWSLRTELPEPWTSWKDTATAELEDIKNASGSMVPEDRVARTMDLQEDIAAKMEILVKNAATEQDLLPQGDKVPQDAQDFKDELNRITKYVTDLQARTKTECDKYSEDVKYWAEYRTGIKEFSPWLAS